MKIIGLKEFLLLPNGTTYMKYEPCVFEDLCVKGDSITGDFFYSNITYEIDCHDSYDFSRKLIDAEENNTSLETNFSCFSRDACYDENQLFAVYEKEDVERLIRRLNSSFCTAYTQQ